MGTLASGAGGGAGPEGGGAGSEGGGAGGAAAGAESLLAPINHCNNRPISRYLQTREHVSAARTTRSVLTHLDSSTFARPL